MKILVTGATGSIGGNIVRKLVERGYDVRVLIRKTSKTLAIDNLKVERYYGDILSYPSVRAAVKGCTHVIHSAGISTPGMGIEYDVFEINDQGALNVAIACLEEGVTRLVHTSTGATVGWGTKEKPATEDMPFNFDDVDMPYWVSKKKAEDKLFKLYKEAGLPVIMTNPTAVIGPWDVNLAAMGKLTLFAHCGATIFYLTSGVNFIDIEDVAIGHINALDKGRIGERYIFGNENLYYKEYFAILNKFLGKFKPIIPVPYIMALLVGMLGDIYIKFAPENYIIKNFLNTKFIKTLYKTLFYSSEKAKKELELPQTPIVNTVEKQVKWLRDYGYLEPNLSIFTLLKAGKMAS